MANSHRLGATGLAAGGAVAAWVEFVLLRRRVGSAASRIGVGSALMRLLPAVIAAGVVMAVLAELLTDIEPLLAAPVVVGVPGLLYLFIAGHIKRVTGAMRIVHWKGSSPYFERNADGEWSYAGTFETGAPLRTSTYHWLAKSRLLKQ